MRKIDKGNCLVVATIVMCFALTLCCCLLFDGAGLLSTFEKKEEEHSFFCVVTGGYSDVTIARSTADLIKLRGGAGYIIQGEEIEIALAVYPDSEQAESVLSKLGDKSAYINEIALKTPDYKWVKTENQDDIKAALTYFDTAYDKLYSVANSLAAGTLSTEDAKTQIRVLSMTIEDIKSDFYSKFSTSDKEEITEIKLALITCMALLDNVNTSGSLAAVLSSVRYQTVQLVLCYQALCSKI